MKKIDKKCKFLEKNVRSYGFKNFEANFPQNFKNMKKCSNPEKLSANLKLLMTTDSKPLAQSPFTRFDDVVANEKQEFKYKNVY